MVDFIEGNGLGETAMMEGAAVGTSPRREGLADGAKDKDTTNGMSEGAGVGTPPTAFEGCGDGDSLGGPQVGLIEEGTEGVLEASLGELVGDCVSSAVGAAEGDSVDSLLGSPDGVSVDVRVDSKRGSIVGAMVGISDDDDIVGDFEASVGSEDGSVEEGSLVGVEEG